jgi:1-acyl-sn-glycerol-3-phosphate acyltransferase
VRVRIVGADRIDPSRSYIFAANHQSIYDIPIVFTSVPSQLRIVAKQSLGRIPFLGWHLHRAGHLLVDRQNPGPGIVKKMAKLAGERHSLIVFPEGTRSADGAVARFKGGSFVFALESGMPVVPISIAGSRHVMTKGRLMVCPGEVTVTVHDPIDTSGIGRDGVRELAERVREVVRQAVDEPTRTI